MRTRCFESGFRYRMLLVVFLGIFMALMFPGKVLAMSSYTGNKPADADLNTEYSFDTVLDANGGMITQYDENYDTYSAETTDLNLAWKWVSNTELEAYFYIPFMPERDGYALVGWSRNKDGSVPEWDIDFNGMISQVSNEKNYPEKIYAVWAKIYEITLYANGGGAFGYETIGGNSLYKHTKKVGFYYDPLKKAINYTDKMKPWPWSKDDDKVLAAWDRIYGPELEGLVLDENTPDQLFADWEYKDLKDARVYYVGDKKYTGRPVTQDLEVCTPELDIKLKEGKDYTLSYQNNVNVGTATVIIRGIGRYTGSTSRTFKIYETITPKTDTEGSDSKTTTAKKANPIKVKPLNVTLKYSALKKKAQKIKVKKAFKVEKAVGKVTYKKSGGNAKITISKDGNITVKKGLKKKTYKLTVKVTAAGNKSYSKATKTVTLKIKVK